VQKEIKGVEIETKIKGIRIKLEADIAMQRKWKFFANGGTPRHTAFSELPKGIFFETEENPAERVLYFKNKEQTSSVLLNLILSHEELLKRENGKVYVMLFNFLAEPGHVYAKTVEEISEKGEYTLKTVYLAGDETTGLLANL
jgi:hypothetical protein